METINAATRYLVATDGTPSSAHAVISACDLVARLGGLAEVHIVHVVDVVPPAQALGLSISVSTVDLMDLGREIVSASCAQAIGHFAGIVRGHLTEGDPAREIVRVAAQIDAGLVIVATAGRRGVSHLLLGSVAEKVVRTAGCPVLVVRPKNHHLAVEPTVEPPCSDCERARAATPPQAWCARHAEHHAHGQTHWEIPPPFAMGMMNFRPSDP